MPKLVFPGAANSCLVRRRFATEIRKEVIDGLLPERFNKGVNDLGVRPVGQPQVTELTVEDGQPLHMRAVFEYVPDFSIDGYKDVTVEKPSVEVTDEEFQTDLEQAAFNLQLKEVPPADDPPYHGMELFS